MKIVGLMCVRDEADLLPQVYPHVREVVDYLYVYEDNSQDNTYDLIKDADYVIQAQNDPERKNRMRGNYHHLLEKVKQDFPNETVWCFIAMGDRFLLNFIPEEICTEANDLGYDSIEGIQLDFLRHRLDPWTKDNDTWRDLSRIREDCRWAKIDERCILAFKVSPHISYDKSKYPWPRGLNPPLFRGETNGNVPFLEHQGRRTPESFRERILSGKRIISRKYSHYDISSWESTANTIGKFYQSYKVVPYINTDTLQYICDIFNDERLNDRVNLRHYYRGMEMAWRINPPPRREDI